jgi:hypothetical protein
MDQTHLKTIEDNPIEGGLDRFRATFRTICQDLENLNDKGSTTPGYFRVRR